MAGRARTFVLAALVLVLLAGGAVWWFVLRDDAPEEAKLEATDCAVSGGAGTPDGSWEVRPATDEEGFVGYRIKELFGGATIKRTAAGRTSDVTGTMTVDGATISDVNVAANLGSLASDQVARDTAIQTRGLETDEFPEATFTMTEPTTLTSAPERGRELRATVKGDLELHGETRPVSVPVEACWTGGTIRVSGSAPVVLADYGIETISTPIVDIDDEGSLEFELTFVPA